VYRFGGQGVVVAREYSRLNGLEWRRSTRRFKALSDSSKDEHVSLEDKYLNEIPSIPLAYNSIDQGSDSIGTHHLLV